MAHDQQASTGMTQSDGGQNIRGAPATPTQPMTERMRSIIPEIAARAEHCEELRMVPPENAETLRRIGYLRAIVPRVYGGGEEEDLVDLYRAGRLLASACPSTAWSMQLLMGHSYLVAAFSKQAQDDIWGSSPDTVACSSFAAMGKFERVPGGIRVSGKYQF